MSAFSEMEASLINERIMAGLEAAKLNGKSLGRPPLVEKNQLALQLYYENRFSVKEIATISGLATSTVYKIIKQVKEKPKN
ncbi:helix-turn-helix domain-containing protein [Carnobacterium maltaromaticum]|uniref:helix-turn-helix domain-containing protein n=1 Tax=Carnobacterium maltaromaticum TaxID=2751 RepID=UPI0039B0AF1F